MATKKAYTGSYPDFIQHSRNYIAQTAKDLAYARKTAKKTYSYKNGSPKKAYTEALKKVYGNEYKHWSLQCRKGASCDVFVGTVLRYSGCDPECPRGLDGQRNRTPNHMKKVSTIKSGDIVIYDGHTRIIVEDKGVLYNCEANHNVDGGQYPHISYSKATKPNKKNLKIFRVKSAFKTSLKKGHKGSEVSKWQKYLKWYGFDCAVDGIFGPKTEGFTKTFQYKNGLTSDGVVGKKTIAKAKAVKK